MQSRLLNAGRRYCELQLEAASTGSARDDLGEHALQEEETSLLSRLSDDENDARELLSEVRSNEGLGPARYEALLWRNAALRALVQPDLQLNEPLLRRLHRMRHGQRLQIRLIVVPTLQEAEELHARLTGGEAFDAIASTRSIDSSRDRGGLVDHQSEDPAWPAALRSELESKQAGELRTSSFSRIDSPDELDRSRCHRFRIHPRRDAGPGPTHPGAARLPRIGGSVMSNRACRSSTRYFVRPGRSTKQADSP